MTDVKDVDDAGDVMTSIVVDEDVLVTYKVGGGNVEDDTGRSLDSTFEDEAVDS